MIRLTTVAAVLFATAVAAQAVSSGEATPVQTLVERAKSELAADQAPKALADADAALAIDASNQGAADVKTRAQASIAGQGQAGPAAASAAALNGEVKRFNDDIAARNAGKEAAYEAGVAQYNARLQSDAASYTQAEADYQAQVKRLDVQRETDLAAWRARVAACSHGDRSQCAAGRRQLTPPPIPAHPLVPQ